MSYWAGDAMIFLEHGTLGMTGSGLLLAMFSGVSCAADSGGKRYHHG